MMVVGCTLTLVSLLALLACEAVNVRIGIWIAKPIASTGFVLAASGAGAVSTTYGRIVLVALVLGWLGDVLLISMSRGTFLAGLCVFLAGHIAYITAFVARGMQWKFVLGSAFLLTLPALGVYRWLRPHIPGPLQWPVRAYVVVITSMVAAAIGSWGRDPDSLELILGALFFYLSDVCVARERFVIHQFGNKLVGLPLYYVGQLLFAYSVYATP